MQARFEAIARQEQTTKGSGRQIEGSSYRPSTKPPTTNKPTNPKGPREFYIKAKQNAVAGVHPHLRMEEVKALIADSWKILTPQEKQKYEALAAEDKVRAPFPSFITPCSPPAAARSADPP